MAIRHKLIMINGEMGIGKTWIAKQLREMRPSTRLVSLNDGLKKVMSGITGLDLFDEHIYAEFKERIYDNGLRGRDWQIQVSEGSKDYDPLVWVKRFVERVQERSSFDLVVCDSFGFPVEFHGLLVREDIEMLTCYVGDLDQIKLEGDYRQFKNDSRFDLSRHCSIRASNSTEALRVIKERIIARNW